MRREVGYWVTWMTLSVGKRMGVGHTSELAVFVKGKTH